MNKIKSLKEVSNSSYSRDGNEYRWTQLVLEFPLWGVDFCVDFNLINQKTKREC